MNQVTIPSPDEIEAARTPAGGWTRDQLAAWGVPWPPPAGWKQRLADQWKAARQQPSPRPGPPAAAPGGGEEPQATPGVVEVPGPEPDWQPATIPPYHVGKNPASQHSLWQAASTLYRIVAGLTPPLAALAARLRLEVEHTWEDPGPVDVALFRLRRTEFALTEVPGKGCTFVWLDRAERDVEAALDLLLGALGIGREAVAFTEDQMNDAQPGTPG